MGRLEIRIVKDPRWENPEYGVVPYGTTAFKEYKRSWERGEEGSAGAKTRKPKNKKT